MESLSNIISQIIAARDSKKSSFNLMNESLKDMLYTVRQIELMSKNGLWESIIANNGLQESWSNILSCSGSLQTQLCPFISPDGLFTLAHQRANRDYVNIGAIGITREGKSKYIDQTTELGEWLLPRRDDQEPCTTAPINVINGSSKETETSPSKKNFVRITHFTVQEMVALLQSYIGELGGDPSIVPNSISTRQLLLNWLSENKNFVDKSLSINLADAFLSKKNSFIEGYFDKAEEYVKYLIENPDKENLWTDYTIEEINQGEEKGKEYYSSVSYYCFPNAPLKSKTFRSYSTKKADIYTEFRVAKEEVEGIQFLDTPGIGEQKVGLERSLSENVAMNLDVILVVKSVRSDKNSQDTNRNTLITLIRRKLDGKTYGKDSVYFLLNMWPDVSYSNGLDELSKLKAGLENEHSTQKIELEDSQYRMINVMSNYEVLSDDKIDRDNPIGKYLYFILSSLVPNIKKIDLDYFKSAETEYGKLEESFNGLKQLMKALSHSLPSSDLTDRVDKLLKSLHDKLDEIIDGDNVIDGGITYSIQNFCDQNAGIILASYLGDPTSTGLSNIDDFQQIQTFCDGHKKALNSKYRKSAYKGYMDFQAYATMKLELCKNVEEAIYACIDTKRADADIKDIKRKLANVFIKTGRLGFIDHDADSWWESMYKFLNSENALPELVEIFKSISDFTIDYKKALEGKLNEIMLVSKHKDDFGNPAIYNFQQYENAVIAITHSLLHIEEAIQAETEENVLKRTIEALVSTLDNKLSDLIRTVSLPEASIKTATRSAMEKFYKKHANEVFTDDDESRKLALISSWENLMK